MDWFGGFCTPAKPATIRVTDPGRNRDCTPDMFGCLEPTAFSTCMQANEKTSKVHVHGIGEQNSSHPSQPALSERVGVGLILALDPSGNMFIHTICPGSSAEGKFQCGDVFMQVDAVDVSHSLPAPYVAALLLGPTGTEIDIVVRRPSEGNSIHRAKLVRRKTDPENVKRAMNTNRS